MHVDAPPLTHNSHTCQRAASRVMPGAWTDYDTNPSEQDLLITYWASHPMACTRRSERTSYRFTQSSGRNATGIPQGHRKPLCAPSHSFARLEWKFNCRPQARWPEAHTQQPPPPSLCPLYAARPLLGPLPNAECPLSVYCVWSRASHSHGQPWRTSTAARATVFSSIMWASRSHGSFWHGPVPRTLAAGCVTTP